MARFGTDSSTEEVDPLIDACGEDPGSICEWVFEQTNSEFLASIADWALAKVVPSLLILIGAFIIVRLVSRSVHSSTKRLANAASDARLGAFEDSDLAVSEEKRHEEMARAEARSESISSVVTSIASLIIWVIALLMVIAQFGVSLAPLLAGAGIAGVALGFGAQTLVKDFISGLFILIEDQYGVGDYVDIGEASGQVQRMTLRITSLRDVNGNLWHVPNGEITAVANQSQVWARALLDIEVAYESDLRQAQRLIAEVADAVWTDPEFEGAILEEPEVWGVQALAADGVAIRLVVKTVPASQWSVERELRLRIKEVFDTAGVEIPYPQRTVWLRGSAT
jgi:small-conductance mechanosensitive channel